MTEVEGTMTNGRVIRLRKAILQNDSETSSIFFHLTFVKSYHLYFLSFKVVSVYHSTILGDL